MISKSLIKEFIPPILLNSWRKYKIYLSRSPTYKKIISNDYSSLKKYQTDIWNNENWINHVKKSLLTQNVNSPTMHVKAVLSSINWIYAIDNKTQINVIDYGGGSGILVPHLRNLEDKLNYSFKKTIIDNAENIKIGQNNIKDLENLEFFDYSEVKLNDVLLQDDNDGLTTVLNISSTLQYIIPYNNFLKNLLSKTKPKVICITRLPRCDDALSDAYGVQDITSSIGYCGSTVINLFGRNTLTELMSSLGYNTILEDFNFEGDTKYFKTCNDKNYKKMTSMAYIFIRHD